MEEGTLIDNTVFSSGEERILIRENGPVLCDNVKKMNSTGFDCLRDVIICWKIEKLLFNDMRPEDANLSEFLNCKMETTLPATSYRQEFQENVPT